MTDLRKAAEMLMKVLDDGWVERGDSVVIALRQALAQPEREWVGLTDEDTANICMQSDLNNWLDEQVIDAVEAKLKEKNNGGT